MLLILDNTIYSDDGKTSALELLDMLTPHMQAYPGYLLSIGEDPHKVYVQKIDEQASMRELTLMLKALKNKAENIPYQEDPFNSLPPLSYRKTFKFKLDADLRVTIEGGPYPLNATRISKILKPFAKPFQNEYTFVVDKEDDHCLFRAKNPQSLEKTMETFTKILQAYESSVEQKIRKKVEKQPVQKRSRGSRLSKADARLKREFIEAHAIADLQKIHEQRKNSEEGKEIETTKEREGESEPTSRYPFFPPPLDPNVEAEDIVGQLQDNTENVVDSFDITANSPTSRKRN